MQNLRHSDSNAITSVMQEDQFIMLQSVFESIK